MHNYPFMGRTSQTLFYHKKQQRTQYKQVSREISVSDIKAYGALGGGSTSMHEALGSASMTTRTGTDGTLLCSRSSLAT